MQEAGIRPLMSPGQETVNDGSPDLENLLQTAEAENLQMVKLIESERQKHEAFQKQITETVRQTEELEESTKNLDIKAKELHNKFKQNREISEGLKKTAIVLDEHEETLQKKLHSVSLELQNQVSEHEKVIEKYERTWEQFHKRYESMPLAKELSLIKKVASDKEMRAQETTDKISQLQTQIIEMEIEKTHMQQYLHGNPESAQQTIVKIAKMFVAAEATAQKVSEELKQLTSIRDELTLLKTRQEAGTKQRKTTEAQIQAKQDMVIAYHQTNVDPASGVPSQQSQPVTNGTIPRPNTNQQVSDTATNVVQSPYRARERVTGALGQPPSSQQNIHPTTTTTTIQSGTNPMVHVINTSLKDRSTIPDDVPSQRITTATTNNQSTVSRRSDTVTQIDQPTINTTDHLIPRMPVISQSEARMLTNQSAPTTSSQSMLSSISTPSHETRLNHSDTPTTVSQSSVSMTVDQSGTTTPTNQPKTVVSQPSDSPLDLNQMHTTFITQASKSPGEGFTYRFRSMYNSSQTNEPASKNTSGGGSEAEVIYEAPLNDIPANNISMNFFQPFHQQLDTSNNHGFQSNIQPSPEKTANFFAQASPQRPGNHRGFSFGPGSTSPNVGGSSIFGGRNTTSTDDSFGTGFSLFGTNQSPQSTTNDGGFTFSFGGGSSGDTSAQESPSKPSGTSGFCLF